MVITQYNYLCDEEFVRTVRHQLASQEPGTPLYELLQEVVNRLEHLIDYVESHVG